MNIFFGKISKLFDIKQIEGGFYIAPKGSSWFGDLNIGDYVYLIGGEKIQFWRAKQWGKKDGEECLFFDILNPDLGIKISQLSMLKFLKITKALAVMTSRSAKNRAFFKLELTKEVTPESLADSNTYLDDEIFRKIRVEKNINDIQETEDIVVYYENENLKIYPSKFIESSILEGFRDNTKYIGLGSVMKDNVLSYFNKIAKTLPTTLDPNRISLRSFYDTFFCEYKEKTKYFLVGAFWDASNPPDQTERFMREGIWFNGYEDKFQEEVKNVPVGSNIAIKAAFVREKTKSVMTIKARGVVIENLQDGQTLKVDWEDDFIPFEVSFGGYMRTIKEVVKAEHIKSIWSPEINSIENTPETDSFQINKVNMNNFPINQILYGPPGTGKTYELQQIIEGWNLKEKTSAEIDYSSFVKNTTWWKVIALALFETKEISVPDLAKHPLIIAKLGSSNIKSLNTRLWSSLQHHTVDHCKNVKLVKRIGERVFYKDDNSRWRLDDEKIFEEQYISLVEAYIDFKNDTLTKNKDYTFTTCHQSLTYEDFIEGIKPDLSKEILEDEEDEKSEKIVYEIRKGIFYNACEKAAQKAGFINLKDCLDRTKEERKELFEKAISENKIHVIFLDEINRCNVSSVFGELITLIEDDKRLGKENEIADITLPYSQDEFGVPANLFIIGTMNTADRSVEALDAALRRRFCFEEMPPLYDLDGLKNDIFEYKAFEILKTINSRIEKLIDKDHTIGHSYLLNKDENSVVDSFYKNIIPLLQEYFFGDYGKLGLVLGKGFVHLKEWDKGTDAFANFDDDASNDFDNRNVYEIIDYRKVADYKLILNKVQVAMDFEKAIQVLMNKKIE